MNTGLSRTLRGALALVFGLGVVAASAAAQARGTAGAATLPITYVGTPACGRLGDRPVQLDLWPGGAFHLQRQGATDDIGSWSEASAGSEIVLQGRDGAIRLNRAADGTAPSCPDGPGQLARSTVAPAEVTVPAAGAVRYLADAAMMEVCATGQSFPVVSAGDWLALERAYLAAEGRGAPILAMAEITIGLRPTVPGPARRTVTVERFLDLRPGEGCVRNRTAAPLEDTRWLLTALDGEPAPPVAEARAAEFRLDPVTGRMNASAGCNTMTGPYAIATEALQLGQLALTRMACPGPLAKRENRLAAALVATARAIRAGQTLFLLDAAGRVRATFDADGDALP